MMGSRLEKEEQILWLRINYENKLIIELKAIINLEDVHLAQTKNYVVAYDFQTGLLINFGAASLQHKLVFNPKYKTIENNKDSGNS